MHRFQRLMVALVGEAVDSGLIAYAGQVATIAGAHEMRFVHVCKEPSEMTGANDMVALLRREVVAQLGEGLPDCPFAYDVIHGPVTDRLLLHVAEKKSDLLLVGHRASHAGQSPLARRLAMKAPCSVWMVPEGSPPRFDQVLVPVDFSTPAADALGIASSLIARQGRGEVLALHVYQGDAVLHPEEFDSVIQGEERNAWEAFVAGVATHGVRLRPIFEESVRPAARIEALAQSHHVDLIVMSTRGRSRSASILLGSVTEEVITTSTRPILVVKHFGASLGVLRALFGEILHKPTPRYG